LEKLDGTVGGLLTAEGLKPFGVEIVDSSACDEVLRLIDFKHHGDTNILRGTLR
jgi:hypothetical protein